MKKIHQLTKKVTIILSIALSFFSTMALGRKGIVIVPIADLAGQPIHTYYAYQPVEAAYHKLPWAHYRGDYASCPRIHQLLYHEIVDIIGTRKNEILIRIPNVFYQTMTDARPQLYYWTLEKNIIPLTSLYKKGLISTHLPTPINFNTPSTSSLLPTVSLLEPFTVPAFNMTFSAGTRFVKAKEQPHEDKVMVYCLHPITHKMTTLAISNSLLYCSNDKPMAERITDFLAILRRWTQPEHGIIPYVWGGCSFTDRHTKNEFSVEKAVIQGKKLGYYIRPTTQVPKTGYDCSSIIVRAAQIVGLPYYYKNTYTIAQQLPALGLQESLKEGDLIWIRGHVLVAANLKQNTVIEASAYDYGYGEVHEIPLGKVFKDVNTFADLHHRYRYKKPIERLHRNGTVLDTYKEMKLLKFASQWA